MMRYNLKLKIKLILHIIRLRKLRPKWLTEGLYIRGRRRVKWEMVEIGVKVLSKEAVVDTERAVLQEKIKEGPLVWIDIEMLATTRGKRKKIMVKGSPTEIVMATKGLTTEADIIQTTEMTWSMMVGENMKKEIILENLCKNQVEITTILCWEIIMIVKAIMILEVEISMRQD